MALDIGTVTNAVSASTAQGPALSTSNVAAPAVTPDQTPNSAANVVAAANTFDATQKIYLDYSSGKIVTEFLSGNGGLQSQFPSRVVIAYLQAGLTAEGFSKNVASASNSPSNTVTTTV